MPISYKSGQLAFLFSQGRKEDYARDGVENIGIPLGGCKGR
jgi:hypothetical protein